MSNFELFGHQIAGADWLRALRRAALTDQQGLGKTATVIEGFNRVMAEMWSSPGGVRVLVVCPSVMLWQWRTEWLRWARRAMVVQVIEHLSDLIHPDTEVVIASHRAIIDPRILRQIAMRTWHLSVLDEAHFFRNPDAQRTCAFYGEYHVKRPCIVSRSHRVWVLTGTPAPNDVRNLWTMCWGLWPDRFPSPVNPQRPMTFAEFEDRYCVTEPTRYGVRVLANQNAPELRERLRGVMLRRTIDECLDLPPIRFETIALRPEKMPHEFELLEALVDPVLIGSLDSPEQAFRALGREKEFSTWRRLCGIAKIEPVIELLQMELEDSDEKLVLFAHHTDVIDGLRAGLEHVFGSRSCVEITGRTSSRNRQRAVDRFQMDPRVRFAICQIVAGGVGVTLTEACDLMFVEMSFVPGDNDQAVYRIRRIGQHRSCRARFVSLAGTVDEPLVEILRRKTKMIREVLS